jgi:hypothetical protein
MAAEISFEYLFFLKHFDIGYRADLCHWDWHKKYIPLRGSRAITVKVDALRGWQAAGINVTAGQEYEFASTGSWKTAKESPLVAADGEEDGTGRLVGIVMKDFELGEPFDLGSYGSFAAPSDGKLYLRCQDAWPKIADNAGKLSVRLKLKGEGKPLSRPPTKAAPKPKPDPAATLGMIWGPLEHELVWGPLPHEASGFF